MLKLNTIHCTNVLAGLKRLPDESVDMVITSPPYWNMRDYGKTTLTVWDGDENCKHKFGKKIIRKHSGGCGNCQVGHHRNGVFQFSSSSRFCAKCGAWKGQLGQEPDFELYVKHLLDIFDEIRRVLKKTGTCWVNLGDTYGGGSMGFARGSCRDNVKMKSSWNKSMLGLPERFMVGMIDRGWTLRNKIVWYKPNHVPSPVKDRFCNSWEHIFFFSKSRKYYFDLDAVRVPHVSQALSANGDYKQKVNRQKGDDKCKSSTPQDLPVIGCPGGKVPDDLWKIAVACLKEAHFAVFPPKLIEMPMLAGCPKHVCKKCGLPKLQRSEAGNKNAFNIRVRDVKKGRIKHYDRKASNKEITSYCENDYVPDAKVKTVFECKCNAGFVPGIVLDPFMGSGTTALVAQGHGRDFLGLELNPQYIKIARKRIRDSQQKKKGES